MARFTTRIELHGADQSDYQVLHEEMRNRGFANMVVSDDGKRYILPPAEYNYEGNISKGDVLDKAKAAASQAVNEYAILVTESDGRTWFGLETP